MKYMRKRYPTTTFTVGLIIVLAAFILIATLWHPAIYIFLACGIVWLLIDAIHRDRKRNAKS